MAVCAGFVGNYHDGDDKGSQSNDNEPFHYASSSSLSRRYATRLT